MFAESIPLRFAGAGSIARLRDLTGRDEIAVSGADTASAIGLLSSLLDDIPPAETERLNAADLVASDRDRLLAAVYERAFGDRIESTRTCARCAQPFDLHFSLQRLADEVNGRTAASEWTHLGGGRFESPNGVSFRLPTGRDELALTGLQASEVKASLLQRCANDVEWPEGRTGLEELLERVAPLLDLELTASCVECGHVHTIQFDIQTYVLGAIMAERRRLLADVNRIAKAYSWSLDEILSLSRNDRRQFVALIESEYAT